MFDIFIVSFLLMVILFCDILLFGLWYAITDAGGAGFLYSATLFFIFFAPQTIAMILPFVVR